MTRSALLLGYPVAHSRSPLFQNAAFEHLGLDVHYDLWPMPDFDPAVVRARLLDPGLLGINVTVPHKLAIIPCLDELTPTAESLGAVNTVFKQNRHGRAWLIGDNTDAPGFLADLQSLGVIPPFESVLVVGAGGAARAVVGALAPLARRTFIVNRTLSKAQDIARSVSITVQGDVLACQLGSRDHSPDLREAVETADLVVDGTSLGLGQRAGTPRFCEARETLRGLDFAKTPKHAFFYDLKYASTSPFLAEAAQLGRSRSHGLGMLLWQGALAFERWTGQSAPLEVMREALAMSETD